MKVVYSRVKELKLRISIFNSLELIKNKLNVKTYYFLKYM